LRVYENGTAEVLDLDGGIHQFESEQVARDWLLEDEYSSLEKLIECGDVAAKNNSRGEVKFFQTNSIRFREQLLSGAVGKAGLCGGRLCR
jgi:hypothetical protein